MNLIFYVHQDASQKGAAFKKVIEQNFKRHEIEYFQTFNAFKARLKQISVYNKEIYVLLADSKNRLTELTKLIDLLEDKRIILILPDESKATLSTALKFFPRFFTPISETYADLCDVLTKMIHQGKINITNNKGGTKDVSNR